jgi:catechol 2,3-dioxygenase-like lactoylglutathione lyase family enzyme
MPLIHTCYRITDIDRSVAFYNALGFQEIGRIPIRDEAVNVFMNQPGDGDMPRLELTYNFGVDSYDLGLHVAECSGEGTRRKAHRLVALKDRPGRECEGPHQDGRGHRDRRDRPVDSRHEERQRAHGHGSGRRLPGGRDAR